LSLQIRWIEKENNRDGIALNALLVFPKGYCEIINNDVRRAVLSKLCKLKLCLRYSLALLHFLSNKKQNAQVTDKIFKGERTYEMYS